MPTCRPFNTLLPEFRAGRDTPRAALERHLQEVAGMDALVRAFRSLDVAAARRDADAATQRWKAGAPLSEIDGMVIGVKDIIDVAGFPTRMNSPVFEQTAPAFQDASCVRAARRSGAVILGKTETAEFASGNSAPTRNPHDLKRSPGGSSSGSGAAVGAGMVSAAFGTQTQGSILRPASYCGAVGYKPSFGVLPLSGIHPVSGSHDHLGALGASVADTWNLCRAVSDFCPGAGHKGLAGKADPVRPARVAVMRMAAFDELEPGCDAIFEAMLGRLSDAGVVVDCSTKAALPANLVKILNGIFDASSGMMGWDMRWPYAGYAARWPGLLGEKITGLLAQAEQTTLAQYREWLSLRDAALAQLVALRNTYDAILMPAASGPAPKGFAFSGSRSFQVPWSFMGAPAWSIPGLSVAGLPFGVQIAGFVGGDDVLVGHAAWLEQALVQ